MLFVYVDSTEETAVTDSDFIPPTVWTPPSDDGAFSGINRPEAGSRYEEDLPVGGHDLQLYSLATPNGQKVTIMLEELLEKGIEEAEYDAWPVDIMEGEQFSSGFVEVNPNSKIPAMVDRDPDPPQRIFESGAILMYLAEKFGAFLPDDPAERVEARSWLFWQVGSAPYLGGGFGHFYEYAPEPMKYPIDRYAMEAKRQLDVLDRRLADHEYLAGESYSVADMATWPWYGQLVVGSLYDAQEFLSVDEYDHIRRWADQISDRPAVRRGRIVNRLWGDDDKQLPERHDASDFDELD